MLDFLAAFLFGTSIALAVVGLASLRAGPGVAARRLARLHGQEETEQKQRRRPLAVLRPRDGFQRLWAGDPGSGLALELEQAGVPLRVGEYVLLRALLALLCGVVMLLGGFHWAAALLAALVGYMVPRLWLAGRRQKRRAKLEAQLLDALPLLANSLRSGYSFLQAVDFTARQLGGPLGAELQRTLQETQLGAELERALQGLDQRVGSTDLELVVTAVLLQRQVGGNLADLLNTVENTMRERARIKGELQSLTGQQRLSGIVIGALPVFLGVVLYLMSPDYISLLFTRTAGQVMLGLAIVMEVLGVLVMRRVLDIQV